MSDQVIAIKEYKGKTLNSFKSLTLNPGDIDEVSSKTLAEFKVAKWRGNSLKLVGGGTPELDFISTVLMGRVQKGVKR